MPIKFEKLLLEQADLQGRIIKIREFQQTPEHAALCQEDQDDLAEQREYMEQYHTVLLRRIANHTPVK